MGTLWLSSSTRTFRKISEWHPLSSGEPKMSKMALKPSTSSRLLIPTLALVLSRVAFADGICPRELWQLSAAARDALRRMRRRPTLVTAFWKQAELF